MRLNYQIGKNKSEVIVLLREYLGGNIGYKNNQVTYYYRSTSFGSV